MNNELQKVKEKLDNICKSFSKSEADSEKAANKFLCFNKNRNLIWYTRQEQNSLDVIIQSDAPAGIGKSLNTEFIALKESVTPDKNNYLLHMTLINMENVTIFNELIFDLIDYSNEAQSGSDAISLVTERFSMWKNMLKHKGEEKGVAKGIIGELLTLIHLLDCGNDPDIVVSGWGGPENTLQDFILDRFWIETKTVGENPSVVSINALGQLDNSEMPGYLHVINAKASDGDKAVSVEKLYNEICAFLKENEKLEALLRFKNKMKEFEYDRFCMPGAYKCEIIKERVYDVRDDFPRLFNRYQMTGIKTVHYDLLLSVIEKWINKQGVRVWQ